MTNIHTILVPVDFTEASGAAVQHAHTLARVFGSRVYLLHVAPIPAGPPGVARSAALQRAADEEFRQAQVGLDAVIAAERLDPITTGAIVLNGYPAELITLFAAEIGADLIVMGLHPNDTKSRLLGHVTERVMRDVTCPVLAIPPHSHTSVVRARSRARELEMAC